MSWNCFKFSLCGVAIRLKRLLFKTQFRDEDVEYATSAAAGSCCVYVNIQRAHTTTTIKKHDTIQVGHSAVF